MAEDGALLTPDEVAARVGVRREVVYSWISGEQLEAIDVARRVGTRPRWRISERALSKFLADRSTQ